MIQEIDLGYIARKPFDKFHARKERWAVIVAHRRAGKTTACILDLIDGALRSEKPLPRFAYIAPLYKQAKTVAWDRLKEYGRKVPGHTINESELRVDFPNGGQVRLYGADNPDTLRGIGLDGCILDEVAQMSPKVFQEVIRPTLADRSGWCVWIGTPKGRNAFYKLWADVQQDETFFKMMLRASESGILPQFELDDLRRQMTPEEYQQEFECSFQAAILGAYYGREMEAAEKDGRVVPNVYDQSLQVHTAWDLGINDATVIWFYQSGGFEIRVIDCYSATDQALDHYVSILQQRAANPANPRGYKYGKHYLPHDVGVAELGTGRTRLETLHSLGVMNTIVVPKLPVPDGINAVRRILPRCWFDVKCGVGIEALQQYRREYDDIRQCFHEKPYHDWTSDYADAFRYLAVGFEEPISKRASKHIRRDNRWIY